MSHDEAINVVLRCRGRIERENILVSPNIVFLDSKDPKLTISIPESNSNSNSNSNIESSRSSIVLNQVSNINKTYKFDQMFGAGADQISIFDKVALDMCDDFLKGYNCTIFAYGQTGSGKTYTMFGENDGNITQKSGIIPRCLNKLFEKVKNETILKCSFIEIYNEELRDLLNPSENDKNLKIYEQKTGDIKLIKIKGLEEFIIKDQIQGFKYLKLGLNKRETQSTKMNLNSSRSHTIFTIHMIKKIDGKDYQLAKFNLVDLAGSENIRKAGSINQRAKEAGSINQSLLTLGKVINALSDKSKFIPYRESKLTRILKDSLGGDTKTTLIATISPTLLDLHSTISTLDYAAKAKNIQNNVQLGSIIKDQIIMSDLIDENRRLQMDLMATRKKEGHIYLDVDNYTESILSNKILKSQVDELKLKNDTLELRFNEINELKLKEVNELNQNLLKMEQTIVNLNNELSFQLKNGDKLKEINYKIGNELIDNIEEIQKDEILVDLSHFETTNNCLDSIRNKLGELMPENDDDDDEKRGNKNGFESILNQLDYIKKNELKLFDYIKNLNTELNKFKKINLNERSNELDNIVRLIHENTDDLRGSNLKNDPTEFKEEIEGSILPTIENFKNSIMESVSKFSDKIFNETLKSTQKIYFEPISESYIKSQNFNNDISKLLFNHKDGLIKIGKQVSNNDIVVNDSKDIIFNVLDNYGDDFENLKIPIGQTIDEINQLNESSNIKFNEDKKIYQSIIFNIDEVFEGLKSQHYFDEDYDKLSQLKKRIINILINKNKNCSLEEETPSSPKKSTTKFSMITMRSPNKRQKRE